MNEELERIKETIESKGGTFHLFNDYPPQEGERMRVLTDGRTLFNCNGQFYWVEAQAVQGPLVLRTR